MAIDENPNSGSMIVKRVEYNKPDSVDEQKSEETQYDSQVLQDSQDPYDFGSDFELEVHKIFN